jgi:hypothetical protein
MRNDQSYTIFYTFCTPRVRGPIYMNLSGLNAWSCFLIIPPMLSCRFLEQQQLLYATHMLGYNITGKIPAGRRIYAINIFSPGYNHLRLTL